MARQPLFALGHPSAPGGGPPADRNHDCGIASCAHNHPKIRPRVAQGHETPTEGER